MSELESEPMTPDEILKRIDAHRPPAVEISRVFLADESKVGKLSKSKRGNTGSIVKQSDVDRVFAYTLKESIRRTKDSVKRFTEKP